jgi:hypothetical protein
MLAQLSDRATALERLSLLPVDFAHQQGGSPQFGSQMFRDAF